MSDEIAKIRARWTGNVTPSTLVDHGKKDALALLDEVERLRHAFDGLRSLVEVLHDARDVTGSAKVALLHAMRGCGHVAPSKLDEVRDLLSRSGLKHAATATDQGDFVSVDFAGSASASKAVRLLAAAGHGCALVTRFRVEVYP